MTRLKRPQHWLQPQLRTHIFGYNTESRTRTGETKGLYSGRWHKMSKGFRNLLIVSVSILLFITVSGPAEASLRFLPKSSPISISIPSLDVNAKLIRLGLEKNGARQVPTTGGVAGWFTGAPTPGDIGPAIISAHVDMGGRQGVFYNIKKLKKNDLISVLSSDGKTVNFQVDSVKTVLKDAFPTQLVYGDLDYAGLRLITCGGAFDVKSGHYKSNIIVFASIVN
jgi:LPXTG-site transpeptidase (sortase) family protein